MGGIYCPTIFEVQTRLMILRRGTGYKVVPVVQIRDEDVEMDEPVNFENFEEAYMYWKLMT